MIGDAGRLFGAATGAPRGGLATRSTSIAGIVGGLRGAVMGAAAGTGVATAGGEAGTGFGGIGVATGGAGLTGGVGRRTGAGSEPLPWSRKPQRGQLTGPFVCKAAALKACEQAGLGQGN